MNCNLGSSIEQSNRNGWWKMCDTLLRISSSSFLWNTCHSYGHRLGLDAGEEGRVG